VSKLATVEKLIALYNAQDADAYAAMFVEHGAEANYRGDVLRDGRDGVRDGLKAMFAQFPQNRAEIRASYAVGDYVVLHEEVFRSPEATPFEVISLYSFSDDLIERVEFVK